MGVRARWAAVVVLPVLVLGACGSQPADPALDAPTAVVAPNADCMAPAVLHDLGLAVAGATPSGVVATTTPAAGAVPDDFTPVSVVVCTPHGSLHDSSGTWLALTASHREGDLDRLVAALRKPSAARSGACSTAQVQAPALWLVDALGHAVRPTWPTDRCGAPRKNVSTALASLTETDREQYPVQPAGS